MPEHERNRPSPQDRLKAALDSLEQGVRDVFSSDGYRRHLEVMGRFHSYSVNNQILISRQRPDASLVAGFTAWKTKFGRHVRAGEHGITIIAPAPTKFEVERDKVGADGRPVLDADGNRVREKVEATRAAFRTATVFDVSQTDGPPLPTLGVDELSGGVRGYAELFDAAVRSCPYPVSVEPVEGGAKGFFSRAEPKRVVVREGMSEAQTLKTLLHETAHARLHDMGPGDAGGLPDQRTREVQAESVAYAVCSRYGIDAGEYSFGYIAGWSSGMDVPELRASLETVRSCAHEMIEDIDLQLLGIERSMAKLACEGAWLQEGVGYLEVHERGDGAWEHTMYALDGTLVDGGVVDADIPNALEAMECACGFHGMEPAAMRAVDMKSLEELVDRAATMRVKSAARRGGEAREDGKPGGAGCRSIAERLADARGCSEALSSAARDGLEARRSAGVER